MEKHSIYCTPEQTKKAARLGAPLRTFTDNDTLTDPRWVTYNCGEYYTPTAEQMICWLEEQGIQITVHVTAFDEWKAVIYTNKDPKAIAETHWFTSRKEATLEAIDAALDYLTEEE